MSFIRSIDDKDAQKLIQEIDDLVILDVRRYNEYKSGKIPNSINIPVEELEWEVGELEEHKEKTILVYCKAGHRSAIACHMLKDAGFKKLYNLSYGTLGYTGKLE